MSTELQIRPDQSAFDEKQLAALRSIGVQGAPPADVALFFHQAARTGLDPFARQIYLINRGGKNTIQVGIDGFRVIRDRKGTYQGHTEEWCGPDGQWKDVWLDKEPPAAARVSIYVKGYVQPVVGIALWSEYAQIGRDGKPQALWFSKPALMLAKCAEALGLRKAYPQDLSGLYTTDELPEAEQDADGVHVVTTMRSTPPLPPAKKPATRSALSWITDIQAAQTMDALTELRGMAVAENALELRSRDGHTVDEWFLRRRDELHQDAAGEPEPIAEEPALVPDYSDETPF
jgi:phage recombination protein Bet